MGQWHCQVDDDRDVLDRPADASIETASAPYVSAFSSANACLRSAHAFDGHQLGPGGALEIAVGDVAASDDADCNLVHEKLSLRAGVDQDRTALALQIGKAGGGKPCRIGWLVMLDDHPVGTKLAGTSGQSAKSSRACRRRRPPSHLGPNSGQRERYPSHGQRPDGWRGLPERFLDIRRAAAGDPGDIRLPC